MGWFHEAASLAAGQHGILTAAEFTELKVRPGTITRAARDGRLVRLHHGVYRVAGHPPTFAGFALAAVRARPGAVVSHRSALMLWDLLSPPPAPGVGSAPPVDLSRTRGRSMNAPSGVRLHAVSELSDVDVTTTEGIPVTTVARSIIDCGKLLKAPQLERLISSAVRDRLCSSAGLVAALARASARGHDGVVTVRPLVDALAEDPTASGLERLGRAVFNEAGLPEPRWHVVMNDDEGFIGEVDCVFEDLRWIVEIDSDRFHTGSDRRRRDAARDRRLPARLHGHPADRVRPGRTTIRHHRPAPPHPRRPAGRHGGRSPRGGLTTGA